MSAGWGHTGKDLQNYHKIIVVCNGYVRVSCRKLLIGWGNFIEASLPDPGDQLCTDDFEGKTAHNVNLAAKVHVCVLF